ncbi:MAG TPA: N-acetyl-gamma-glutamyl-phosphate reductase [Candidatus Brocadiia bacterium]|nr:N-acetyl-gamma-glutamyl-phosphate reductase [Candidatus Brocadiia bacterium]
MINVAIEGATAYSSLELIQILLRHPEAKIVHLGGRREGNPHIAEIFPSLKGRLDMRLGGLEAEALPPGTDVVFTTLSNAVPMTLAPGYLKAGCRVIDFSADYRFTDSAIYERVYKTPHVDVENLEKAVYGLPEIFREEIAGARLVGNPGCYPTASALALAPLIAAGVVDPVGIIVDAKSGVSGRGNKPDPGSLYCACNESLSAYAVGNHRHEPEIECSLTRATGRPVSLCFTPHLIPMDRGILCTCYARMSSKVDLGELEEILQNAYGREPFVRLRKSPELPATKDVSFTNYCDVAVRIAKGDTVIAIAVIDNLMKGAASQAVQNMNVICGLPETTGLIGRL